MKKTLIILVLLFSSSMVAEDISDFQIEGMSIGDSLLDYFSKEIIKNNTDDNEFEQWDPNPKYVTVYLDEVYLKKYDYLQIHILNNDENYKIYSIQAKIFKDFENCEKNKKEIGEELSILFNNQKKDIFYNQKMKGDNTGESTYSGIYFKFSSGDLAGVYCYDWSKESKYWDNLRVSLYSYEFYSWLRTISK